MCRLAIKKMLTVVRTPAKTSTSTTARNTSAKSDRMSMTDKVVPRLESIFN